MFLATLALSVTAITGSNAFPWTHSKSSDYVVKERHPVPLAWRNIGAAAKDEYVHLQIGLKQSNEGLVEQHLTEVSDPRHARYGQHLSADEIDEIVRPSDDSVELVKAWLAEHGIDNIGQSSAKDWIAVYIPLEKAESLLQTTYSKFQHWDGSVVSRAPEWSLPAHLHDHIDVVQPTNSFFKAKREIFQPLLDTETHPVAWLDTANKNVYPHAPPGYAGSAGAIPDPAVIAQVCNISFTTPTCLRTLYGTIDYEPKAAGKNKVGLCNYLNETNYRADALQFLKKFRPEAAEAANEFTIEVIANANNDQGPYTPEQIEDGKNIEGNLDAQEILSISWPTPLTAFSTGGEPPFIKDLHTPTDTNEPYLTFLNYVLAQKDLPQVISTSYGDDEQTVPESYAKRACAGYAQLGARGITVLFSSGDYGVGANGTCYSNTDPNKRMFIPAFPAGCPWVTTVGGTAGFNPEVAVSRFGSGAGFANYFPAPDYQKSTVAAYIESLDGLYDGLYNKAGRGYPDVAAQGNHDAIVWAGNVTTVGGTSASVPTFSAIIALVNDALLSKGKPPLGFINPWIYGGAYKALTDITSGSSIGCNGSGFPAQEGWDAVTGFGTPVFGKLVEAAFEKYGGWSWDE